MISEEKSNKTPDNKIAGSDLQTPKSKMGDLNSDTEILIVEDSPTQSMKLRYILEKNGYSVTDAQNGKEALDYVKMDTNNLPTIIISDINMPVMDGYEFCRQLKSDEHTKGIPVILLTTLSEPEDIFKGLNSGWELYQLLF